MESKEKKLCWSLELNHFYIIKISAEKVRLEFVSHERKWASEKKLFKKFSQESFQKDAGKCDSRLNLVQLK